MASLMTCHEYDYLYRLTPPICLSLNHHKPEGFMSYTDNMMRI